MYMLHYFNHFSPDKKFVLFLFVDTHSHFAVIRTIGRSRQSMTAPVTPEYAGAADAHAAPLVDQEYLRKDDQTKYGEEHDNQHERHVGTLLENAGVWSTPTGAGSSARAHARRDSASDNPRQSHSRLNQILGRFANFGDAIRECLSKVFLKLKIWGGKNDCRG